MSRGVRTEALNICRLPDLILTAEIGFDTSWLELSESKIMICRIVLVPCTVALTQKIQKKGSFRGKRLWWLSSSNTR